MKLNPYNDKNLKFPLFQNEIKILDDVWNFMDEFRKMKLTRSKYRKHCIKKIKNKYSIDEFYELEIIVEKIYWNLVSKIKKYINTKSKIFLKKKFNLNEMKNKILTRNKKIKESVIRKLYTITKNNDLIYKYEYPNDLDLLVASIMINRSLYETIINDIDVLSDIEIQPYNNLIEFDYSYPNLNTLKSFTSIKKERIENIYKMYYKNNAEKNWFD